MCKGMHEYLKGFDLRHGVEQGTGRTFAISKQNGRRVVSHGGCLGAFFEVWPDDNFIMVIAFFPEDTAMVKSCDNTAHFATLLGTTRWKMSNAFTVPCLAYSVASRIHKTKMIHHAL